MRGSSTSQAIEALLRSILAVVNDITIAVVANIRRSHTAGSECDEASRDSEYLSENESSQLLLSLHESGFFSRFYDWEQPFIESVVNGDFYRLPRRYKLVYNLAQTGTGPGRKSLIPAFCHLHGIAVCNSNPYVVSLARHKYHVSCILRQARISALPSWLFSLDSGWLLGQAPPPGVRLIAKACFESASIGLTSRSVGTMTDEFMNVLCRTSQILDQPVVVQPFVSGFEVEVPVLQLLGAYVALEPISITIQGNAHIGDRFLDYDAVLNDNYGFTVSHHLPDETRVGLRNTAVATCRLLGIRGLGRVDFRLSDHDGTFVVTDVSTSPHIVRHSSLYFAFSKMGFSHAEMLATIIGANAALNSWI